MTLPRAFWRRLAGNALNEPSEGLLGLSESLLVTFDAKAKEVGHVGLGFSLSGRALALYRGWTLDGSADSFVVKTRHF